MPFYFLPFLTFPFFQSFSRSDMLCIKLFVITIIIFRTYISNFKIKFNLGFAIALEDLYSKSSTKFFSPLYRSSFHFRKRVSFLVTSLFSVHFVLISLLNWFGSSVGSVHICNPYLFIMFISVCICGK